MKKWLKKYWRVCKFYGLPYHIGAVALILAYLLDKLLT